MCTPLRYSNLVLCLLGPPQFFMRLHHQPYLIISGVDDGMNVQAPQTFILSARRPSYLIIHLCLKNKAGFVTIRAVTARDRNIFSAYLGQSMGLFKQFGTKMGGRAPPGSSV